LHADLQEVLRGEGRLTRARWAELYRATLCTIAADGDALQGC